jgi:hypothetical protein
MMGPWTFSKVAMTALVPLWFVACAWAFWRRSWLGGHAIMRPESGVVASRQVLTPLTATKATT